MSEIEKKYGMDIDSMYNKILDLKNKSEKNIIIKDRGNKWLKTIASNFKMMKKNF